MWGLLNRDLTETVKNSAVRVFLKEMTDVAIDLAADY